MGLQEDLYVGVVSSQRMDECLENRNSIFGTVPLMPKRSEGQPVRGTVGQVELAIWVKTLVLRVGQARARRLQHAGEFLSRGSLGLELLNLHKIVELLLAHG